MNSLRKWFYRPRRDDTSLMAQFYYADEELNLVAGELDSFDGRKDPERCTALVNQLRQAQDKVLNICIEMMDGLLPDERALRDFRVKFPDDVMQETLSGQLWFGAECLAAGSSILNRETESTKMRPLAKAVTKTIENVRNLLREQCLKPIPEFTEKIRESLKIFDRLFADFELSYVSAMVPVKTVEEYEMQQNVAVLFSDTLQRAVKLELVTQEQIDNCDPALMFTIPRLAIIAGLVIFPEGPLNLEKDSKSLSELFRPFKNLLIKIRELLWTMSPQELATLEKCLCSMEEPDINIQSLQKESTVSSTVYRGPVAYTSDFVHKFYSNHPSCRQLTPEMISLYFSGKKLDKNDRKRERNSTKASRTRARQERQSERFLSRLTGVEERPRAKRRTRRGSSQYPHYYQYPEHYDELCPPPPNAFPNHENISHCTASARQQGPPHQRGNAVRPIHHRNSNAERKNTHYSSRHHRSRQLCHNTRHRTSRISTIVCACGTTGTASTVSNIPDRYIPLPHLSDEEFHRGDGQILYSNNEDNIPSSSGCPHMVYSPYFGAEVCAYHDPNSNSYENHPCGLYNDYSVTNVDAMSGQFDDGPRSPTNVQDYGSNTVVISDSCTLSPVSFYDQDGTSEAVTVVGADAEVDTMSSDVQHLSLVDGSLNTEISCDDCNNLQNCCCDKDNCDSGDKEKEGSRVRALHDEGHETSPRNREEIGSSNSPRNNSSFSTESLTGPLPPVPEPRHSYSTLRPSYPPPRPVPRQMCSKTSEKDEPFCDCELQQEDVKSSMDNLKEISSYAEDQDHDDSSGSTSPHHSGTEDDEEVALALQAAEVAVSWKARERFSDPGDLIQRLFVCVAGVADQLQTNYASDLRKILRCVFVMNQTPEEEEVEILEGKEHIIMRRDNASEDVSSTNGSEQLSVESAEDALIVIGTPETGGMLNSPDEVSDLEEEDTSLNLSSAHSDEADPIGILHTSSVTVPPSIFNDHSLMQYSAMSPPPFSNDFGIIHENLAEVSGLGSPTNDVSLPSGISSSAFSMCLSPREGTESTLNLNAIAASVNSILALDPTPALPSIATMAPVASSGSYPYGDASLSSVRRASFDPPSPSARPSPTVSTVESNDAPNRHYPTMIHEPPSWIPDQLAPRCMACGALFTVVRRRHHCRNCGKVFCGHCSRHSVPLPHFGIWKNVRVCNACFLYYVTSTADGSSALS